MKAGKPSAPVNLMYRCAGPNCGTLKGATDHWWLMWTSFAEFNRLVGVEEKYALGERFGVK